MWRDLWFRLQALLRLGAIERDLDAELREHLVHQTQWRIQQGMSPEKAARQAALDLGAVEALKEDCRDTWGIRWLEDLGRDLGFSARLLRQTPGFCTAAVVSLALGLGANAVVFGMLNGLLLKPFPVPAPERIVSVQDSRYTTQSFPNYRDFRDRGTSVAALAAYRLDPIGLGAVGASEIAWGYLVTGNYFDVLSIAPWRGRLFTATDDGAPGANRVVVLSFAYWQQRFAADPEVVGHTVRINTRDYIVVGVAPPEFHGTERFYRAQVWVPISMQAEIEGATQLETRNSFGSYVIGRLAPGMSPSQAEAALNAVASSLAREFPDANSGLSVHVSQPGWLGLGAPVTGFARGLMALAALVLLAACANLAGLLLIRAMDRHREIGIRLAIGAGRGRIVRQLLAEVLLLTLIGGLAGAGLAAFLLKALSRWRAPLQLPIQLDLSADWRVLLFAGLATAITTIVCGLAPARIAWRLDLVRASRGLPPAPDRRTRWSARELVMVAQVAICSLLVLSSFIAIRGLWRALDAPVGMRLENVDVVGVDLALAKFSRQEGRAFQRRLLDASLALPGVVAAAYTSGLPLHIDQSSTTVFRDHAVDFRGNAGTQATTYSMSVGYFKTMGTRLLRGRDFTWADDQNVEPVAIVHQRFARVVLGVEDGVGARFRFGRDGKAVTVVGVVEDGKYVSVVEDSRPALFRPESQSYASNTDFLIRRAPGTASLAAELRGLVARLNPDVPVYTSGPAVDVLDFALLPVRAAAIAIIAFAILAAMLALTGIYAVAAFAVSRQTREIGIRAAIGARPSQILRAILGRVSTLVAVGTVIGLAAGIATSPVLGALVYGKTTLAPSLVVLGGITMILVGIMATWLPARRALTVSPITTLRID